MSRYLFQLIFVPHLSMLVLIYIRINIRIKGNENEIFEIQYYLETNGSLDPAELYRCPDGYEFDDNVLRCQKEEDVECEKTADSVQERLESPAITLQVSELDSFFRRWTF